MIRIKYFDKFKSNPLGKIITIRNIKFHNMAIFRFYFDIMIFIIL